MKKPTLFNCLPGKTGPINCVFESMLDDVYTLCASSSIYNWSVIFWATLLLGFNWLPNICVTCISLAENTFISFDVSFDDEWLRLCVLIISCVGELGGEFLISVRVIEADSYGFDCASYEIFRSENDPSSGVLQDIVLKLVIWILNY